DHRPLADPVQPVAQAHRRRRLALARRGRVDRGDKDQLAVRPVLKRGDEVLADLGLVVAIGQQVLGADAQAGADLKDGFLLRRAGDLDIGLHGFSLLVPAGRRFTVSYRLDPWATAAIPTFVAPEAPTGRTARSALGRDHALAQHEAAV